MLILAKILGVFSHYFPALCLYLAMVRLSFVLCSIAVVKCFILNIADFMISPACSVNAINGICMNYVSTIYKCDASMRVAFFFSYFDKYPNYVEAIIRFQCFFCRSHFFCLVCVRAPVNRLLSIIAYVRSYITLLLKRSEKRPCQFFHCEPSSFYLCCAANHTTTYFASFENINNCDADKKRKAALFISTYISFGLSFSFIRFS